MDICWEVQNVQIVLGFFYARLGTTWKQCNPRMMLCCVLLSVISQSEQNPLCFFF